MFTKLLLIGTIAVDTTPSNERGNGNLDTTKPANPTNGKAKPGKPESDEKTTDRPEEVDPKEKVSEPKTKKLNDSKKNVPKKGDPNGPENNDPKKDNSKDASKVGTGKNVTIVNNDQACMAATHGNIGVCAGASNVKNVKSITVPVEKNPSGRRLESVDIFFAKVLKEEYIKFDKSPSPLIIFHDAYPPVPRFQKFCEEPDVWYTMQSNNTLNRISNDIQQHVEDAVGFVAMVRDRQKHPIFSRIQLGFTDFLVRHANTIQPRENETFSKAMSQVVMKFWHTPKNMNPAYPVPASINAVDISKLKNERKCTQSYFPLHLAWFPSHHSVFRFGGIQCPEDSQSLPTSSSLSPTTASTSAATICPSGYGSVPGSVEGDGLDGEYIATKSKCSLDCTKNTACNSFNWSPTAKKNCVLYANKGPTPTLGTYLDYMFCVKVETGADSSEIKRTVIYRRATPTPPEEQCMTVFDDKTSYLNSGKSVSGVSATARLDLENGCTIAVEGEVAGKFELLTTVLDTYNRPQIPYGCFVKGSKCGSIRKQFMMATYGIKKEFEDVRLTCKCIPVVPVIQITDKELENSKLDLKIEKVQLLQAPIKWVEQAKVEHEKLKKTIVETNNFQTQFKINFENFIKSPEGQKVLKKEGTQADLQNCVMLNFKPREPMTVFIEIGNTETYRKVVYPGNSFSQPQCVTQKLVGEDVEMRYRVSEDAFKSIMGSMILGSRRLGERSLAENIELDCDVVNKEHFGGTDVQDFTKCSKEGDYVVLKKEKEKRFVTKPIEQVSNASIGPSPSQDGKGPKELGISMGSMMLIPLLFAM